MAPQRPIGFWLKLVDGLITEQFDEAMEEHGVTRRQWQIMNLLADKPAMAAELQEALAPFFERAAEETAADLDELAESGWIAAHGEHYALTDVGRNSLATLTELVEQNRATAGDGISAEEYAAAVDVLQRMARNLGWNG